MKANKELYYIRGIKGRGDEVVKTLMDKYEVDAVCQSNGENSEALYFVKRGFIIGTIACNKEYALLQEYGTELHLPEKPKMQKWEDIKKTDGYIIGGGKYIFHNKSNCIFATEQQAKSARAAAMISQIRAQCKESYGEIIPKGRNAYIIILRQCDGGMNPIISNTQILYGSILYDGELLRFENEDQARLFLDNNRELVEEYLKTF